MKLTGLLNASGKQWAAGLRLLIKGNGLAVEVEDKKRYVPGNKPGTFMEEVEGYKVKFLSLPEQVLDEHDVAVTIGTLDLDAKRVYDTLDIDFSNWGSKRTAVVSEIYKHFDPREKPNFYRFIGNGYAPGIEKSPG